MCSMSFSSEKKTIKILISTNVSSFPLVIPPPRLLVQGISVFNSDFPFCSGTEDYIFCICINFHRGCFTESTADKTFTLLISLQKLPVRL